MDLKGLILFQADVDIKEANSDSFTNGFWPRFLLKFPRRRSRPGESTADWAGDCGIRQAETSRLLDPSSAVEL